MIYSAQTDAAIFAGHQHLYRKETRHSNWRYPGLPEMTPEQRNDFLDRAILRYITGHDDDAGDRIMAFTTAGSIVQPDRQTLSVFADQLYYDDEWRRAFMTIQMMEGERVWEIHNVENPVEMVELGEGGQTRTQRVTSTKEEYEVADYAAELGFTRNMLTGNRLSQFVTSIMQMRTAYQRALADSHYSVLATASTTGAGSQISFAGSATDSTLVRDIATLNNGLAKIETDLQDIDPEHVMMGRYIVYVRGIVLKGRMVSAVNATLERLAIEREAGASSATVQRTVEVVETLNGQIPSDKAVLTLAGRKIQSADAGARSYQVIDPKSENLCRMLWGTWKGVVADSRQVVELSTS